jgi:hypothetical protein
MQHTPGGSSDIVDMGEYHDGDLLAGMVVRHRSAAAAFNSRDRLVASALKAMRTPFMPEPRLLARPGYLSCKSQSGRSNLIPRSPRPVQLLFMAVAVLLAPRFSSSASCSS